MLKAATRRRWPSPDSIHRITTAFGMVLLLSSLLTVGCHAQEQSDRNRNGLEPRQQLRAAFVQAGQGGPPAYRFRRGKVVIPPIYNDSKGFENGRCVVHLGGYLPLVDDARPDWVGGQWLLIDRKGRELAMIEFD